jgi:hypothetical protein
VGLAYLLEGSLEVVHLLLLEEVSIIQVILLMELLPNILEEMEV